MQKITTNDGSVTFFNEKYQDIYHTRSGAVEEAFGKYVRPAGIEKLAKKGEIKILDVCFGLGYNSCAALDVILDTNPDCRITIIGLENDYEILKKISEIETVMKNYWIIQKTAADLQYVSGNITVRLMIGDAKETIRQCVELFDAVFFDPFSPGRQPEMWCTEFFKDIKKRMKKGAILATYSYARMVRDNLKQAGFRVSDGPIIGRRSPSTLAVNL